jgi:F-type H+-transporting ATPase subunit b
MITDLQHQLGIDSSFFWQFLIFFAAFIILRATFFGPYLKLIERREGQSGGLSEEARKLEEEASRLEKEYENSAVAMRKRAFAEREALLTAARKESTVVVAAAREKAKARMDLARETTAKDYEAELASLKSQVGPVSSLLADRLAQTKVGI